MDTKFSLEEVEKTFTKYKPKQLVEGIIIAIEENGVVFNLGGKLDAFISKSEMNDFNNAKIGDRFSVFILGGKSENGMVLASKNQAEDILLGNQNAKNIKLGSSFTCVINGVQNNGLVSNLGEYKIYIPENEICSYRTINPKTFISKKVDVVAMEINSEEKKIIGSIRILEDKVREANQEAFWRTMFINKIVDGTVKNFVPYGAFVDVAGVSCLLHISNVSNKHINSASEVLQLGKTYKFRILQLDRENKKVSLGYKQLQE